MGKVHKIYPEPYWVPGISRTILVSQSGKVFISFPLSPAAPLAGWWQHVILFLSRRKYVGHNKTPSLCRTFTLQGGGLGATSSHLSL